MTEDYALGMELKKQKYHCRYVREYLALGTPPSDLTSKVLLAVAIAETACRHVEMVKDNPIMFPLVYLTALASPCR